MFLVLFKAGTGDSNKLKCGAKNMVVGTVYDVLLLRGDLKF